MELRVGAIFTSAAVGPGLRTAILLQGCNGPIGRARAEVMADGSRDGHCVGCHASIFWDRANGWGIDPIVLARAVLATGRDMSLLGGEPLLQAAVLRHFLWEIKRNEGAPEVAIYSGSYFEDLLEMASHNNALWDCLAMIDVLVDGPFRATLDDDSLSWRGSRNQRAVDVPLSLAMGEIILSEGWGNGGMTILPDGRIVAAIADATSLAAHGLGRSNHYHKCGAIDK